jgi:hypothetical protein
MTSLETIRDMLAFVMKEISEAQQTGVIPENERKAAELATYHLLNADNELYAMLIRTDPDDDGSF